MIRQLVAASFLAAVATATVAQTAQPTPAEKAGAAMSNAAQGVANAASDAAQATKNAAVNAANATARVVNGWVADLDGLKDGWTIKRSVIGQSVYNEANERIGEIDDIIVMPQTSMAYAVVGVGGFLGIGEHDVVTPLSSLKRADGKFVMSGVTKDSVKNAPRYTYTR